MSAVHFSATVERRPAVGAGPVTIVVGKVFFLPGKTISRPAYIRVVCDMKFGGGFSEPSLNSAHPKNEQATSATTQVICYARQTLVSSSYLFAVYDIHIRNECAVLF